MGDFIQIISGSLDLGHSLTIPSSFKHNQSNKTFKPGDIMASYICLLNQKFILIKY